MGFIIEGEVVDTYGGDYTYRDVYFEMEDGERVFYEIYYGSKPIKEVMITDEKEIAEFNKELDQI